ncbi:MAG: HAMP domain-containing histidine kinase [Cyclobacteriaceae bacterium]|nr:HAMP domain-containing histidine kinase [Cyclobacteriaceae bacterium]
MRLLQVSIRSLLLYAFVLVLISIPVSFYSVRTILKEEVDESLLLHTNQFLQHIKKFESLDDLETDLTVLDQLSYNIKIKPIDSTLNTKEFQTIYLYDSMEQEQRPFRQLSSSVEIKGQPYLLTIRMSLIGNDELVFAIGSVQILLIVLLIAGLLMINRSLNKKLWKPFYRILERLKAYQLDKSESFQTEETNIVEFDDLNRTAIHLMERNRKIFLEQKEFIENASHELQTPLAIFQSKLDNLMQNPSMSESDAMTIAELEETAQRMSRLNKNLLLLSKIDNEQFGALHDIELSKLINSLIDNVKSIAEEEEINWNVKLNPLHIKANQTLTEILLTNLIHNAIRHNVNGGKVSILLESKTLTISNTGKALQMNQDKMFERFSKEGVAENSTGLGLAIVKKICESNHYSLSYEFGKGTHTFSISF